MQRISVRNLQPGMVVGRNVYDASGKLLLASGFSLNQQFIHGLAQLGINSIYVENNLLDEELVVDVLREETRVMAIKSVKECFANYGLMKKKVDVDKIKIAASHIVDEIILNPTAMVQLTDIRTHDDYTFAHSVNMCSLTVLLAASIGYNQAQLKDLALGSLLHDIGKVEISNDILNKPMQLDDSEWRIMHHHPMAGFQILKKQGNIPAPAMIVCYAHHERYDGAGYPRGVAGEEIHEYARLAAIADVFDAVTADRPYRPALMLHEAYDLLMASSGTHFDPRLLAKFLQSIAVYPVGSVVELSNGATAVVKAVHSGIAWRPTVQLLADASMSTAVRGEAIDLRETLSITVRKVFREQEVLGLMKQLNLPW